MGFGFLQRYDWGHMRVLRVCLGLGICFGADAVRKPRFTEYPVHNIYHGKRAKPLIKPEVSQYPGYLAVLGDSRKAPNFAGHYVVSEDTCGSDSVRLMIADAQIGSVFDRIPCFFWDYSAGPNERTDLQYGVEYRPGSALLIAHGCFYADDPRCGDHYYRMTPRGLVSITWIPFQPPLSQEAEPLLSRRGMVLRP